MKSRWHHTISYIEWQDSKIISSYIHSYALLSLLVEHSWHVQVLHTQGRRNRSGCKTGPLFQTRSFKDFRANQKTNAWQTNINISYTNVNNINYKTNEKDIVLSLSFILRKNSIIYTPAMHARVT